VLLFAVAYSISSAMRILVPLLLFDDIVPWVGSTALRIASMAAALSWGIASDFVPPRRLLVVVGIVGVPAVLVAWLLGRFGWYLPQVLLLGLSVGALYSLLWVLMADHLGTGHIATIGVVSFYVGSTLGAWAGPYLARQLLAVSSSLGVAFLIAVLWVVLIVAAAKTRPLPVLAKGSSVPE
jgi:hypothetical protein